MRIPRVAALSAAVATLLLSPVSPAAHATTHHGARSQAAVPAAGNGTPSATDLLAATQNCHQVSHGTFKASLGGAPIPVCSSNGAYYWHSSMSVDCDGQATDKCNSHTDPDYRSTTAVPQSNGAPLNAATTPYVVLPDRHSPIWSYFNEAGIRPGDVIAVIYGGHVEYAIFGDVGDSDHIGEASYATAAALGINPDPHKGGVPGGVTYIAFPHTRPNIVEDHGQAVTNGAAAATAFLHH
ncbi:glycoside hydrolase family 75 protein [Streptomyces noursei]|uniref:glycoside hydrolase family 75 protein n=1 Tax=Streptomyces noursei TaxID=1971 RepID=UPI0030F1DD73